MAIRDLFSRKTWDNLIRFVTNPVDIKKVAKDVEVEARLYATEMHRRILMEAPDGSKWEDPAEVMKWRRTFPSGIKSERPSIRLFGTTLKDSIQEPRIDKYTSPSGKIDITISNNITAPHLGIILNGYDHHKLVVAGMYTGSSDNQTLFFFHGGRARHPVYTTHPNQEPNDFLGRATLKNMDEWEKLKDNFRKIVFRQMTTNFKYG